MKRWVVVFVCIVCVISFAYADEKHSLVEVPEFDIVIAGQICGKDKPLLSEKNMWFVPVRTACEMLGISEENISWNSTSNAMSFKDNDAIITIKADSKVVEVNTVVSELKKAPMIYKGTLYAPLDFFESVLECKAVWDEPKGIIYLQREEEYGRIYNLLSEAVTADVKSTKKLICTYISSVELRDDENEYLIDEQNEIGCFEFNFKTGECVDEGSYTRWGRNFDYRDHCKANVLYKTFMGETEKVTNLKEVNAFTEGILNNAYLTRVNKKIENIPIVNANISGFSLAELEKLALVLKTKDYTGRDAVLVYGSLLGIEKTLRTPGIIDEQIAYMIDNKTGKLLQVGGSSIVRKLIYGISVRQTSEWSYFYAVE